MTACENNGNTNAKSDSSEKTGKQEESSSTDKAYSNEETPEQAVKNFLTAIKNGDGRTAASYIDWSKMKRRSKSESDFIQRQKEAIEYELTREGGIARFSIKDVEKDGDECEVYTIITYKNGEESSMRYSLSKVDGKWIIVN